MKYFLIANVVLCSLPTFAQNIPTPAEVPSHQITTDFSDWKFGIGIGVEQYREPYIETASIRGSERIVVTETSYRTHPSVWLTMNWNIWGIKKNIPTGGANNDVGDTKWGFFAGIKLLDGNSNSLNAFALGPQVSFRTKEKTISVGLGWVTHRTRKFANGIEEGKPLPAQYDDIAYENSTENSYMLMFSVGF